MSRFAALEADMRQVPAAVSYRLARAIKRQLKPTFLPERGKPLTRLDGNVSDEPYRLRPAFEPPVITDAGLYAVQLLDADGRDVGLPRSLYRGVTLPKWPPDETLDQRDDVEVRTPAADPAHDSATQFQS